MNLFWPCRFLGTWVWTDGWPWPSSCPSSSPVPRDFFDPWSPAAESGTARHSRPWWIVLPAPGERRTADGTIRTPGQDGPLRQVVHGRSSTRYRERDSFFYIYMYALRQWYVTQVSICVCIVMYKIRCFWCWNISWNISKIFPYLIKYFKTQCNYACLVCFCPIGPWHKI